MVILIRLLVNERLRRKKAEFGWPIGLALGSLWLVGTWWSTASLSMFVEDISLKQAGFGLNIAWLILIIFGILTGKDLTWHISVERLLFFRLPFLQLYAASTLVGIMSFPVLIGLVVLTTLAWTESTTALRFSGQLATVLLVTLTVRFSVSLVRTCILCAYALRYRAKIAAWVALLGLVATVGAALMLASASVWLPGYRCALIILGSHMLPHLVILALMVLALALMDYYVEGERVFEGVAGPPPLWTGRTWQRLLYFLAPSALAALWRISLLGWLRLRNALLMWIFGVAYGFFFLYFLDEEVDATTCMLFALILLLFHGYLRGNLLGIDRRGAWLYFMLPLPIEKALFAKNSSLSLWQASMVGAVLLGTAVRPAPEMTHVAGWLLVCSFVISAIVLGEIVGSVFSVFCPEPIDRTSRYSGGTAPGALFVPILQAILLGTFLVYRALALPYLPALVAAIPLVALPVTLWIVRFTVLPWWIRRNLVNRREIFLHSLSALPS